MRSSLLCLCLLVASACATAPAPGSAKNPLDLVTLLNLERSGAPSGFSPSDVLFLNDKSGTMQLYRKRGNAITQLTSFPDRISSYQLSPDGKRLVFAKDQGGDENDQLYLLTLATGAIRPLTGQPKVKHTLPVFDPTGQRIAFTSTQRNGKDFDLYVAALDGSGDGLLQLPPTKELSGSHAVAALDGERVLLIEAKSNVDQNLILFDGKQLTTLTPHTQDEHWTGAVFSADRRGIYALSDRGSEQVRLVRLEIATLEQKVIYEQPYDLEMLVVDPTPRADGERLLVLVNERGVERAQLLSVTGAAAATLVTARPTRLGGFAAGAKFALDGKTVLVGIEDPTEPSAIHALDWSSANSKRLTDRPAAIAGHRLAPADLRQFKSFDGRPIDYFWYAPVSKVAAKSPVLVLVHGGPEAQSKVNFSPIIQYLATRGIAVAVPNVRGSTGYGKSFSHLDDRDKREDSVRDVAELAGVLAKLPDVDGKKLAVYGGSYGGYMVLASLTLYPDLWAAGVDIVGIANFRTFLEQTAPYRRALREAEYGALATDGALLDKISPIHKVDKIAAPLFVVHGARDPRVPVGEARQIESALKARGLPVELLVYEDEGHGLAKRANRLDAYPKVMKFLEARLLQK